MSKNLYITATEERSGKSLVVLGIMQMLMKELHRVAFFRPIISDLGLVLPDGLDDAAWVVNAYLIAFVAVMPIAAWSSPGGRGRSRDTNRVVSSTRAVS